MTKPIKVFEQVTKDQIIKIHSVIRGAGLPTEDLYKKVADLVAIPCITALSKQEAIFLIDQLQGKGKRCPSGPLYENEISSDTSKLPSFYHIRDIRLMIKELGWNKQYLKNWLIKYRKIKDVRSMDRKQARISYFILKGMVERKRAVGQEKGKRKVES